MGKSKRRKIRAWIDATRLLLPSSAKLGFNARLSQAEQSVNPQNSEIQVWKNTTRLLLPSSAKPEFNARLSQAEQSVNSHNSGTAAETLSDIKAIFASNGMMNSRGTTVEDYLNPLFCLNATKERIKAAKEEVARQQALLDRHYASASAFLNEFAPASVSGVTASRASLNTRRL